MRLLAPTVTTAALLVSLAGAASADQWKNAYPLTGRPDVHVRAGDARIQVVRWNQPSVSVRVVTTGWHIRPGAVVVEDHSAGNHVDVAVREPHYHFHIDFGWDAKRIQVEVMVPQGADVEAVTSDGAILVTGVDGAIRLHTSDGSITVEGAKGALKLETSDGRITARDVQGTLDARTADGSMLVDGRFETLRLSTQDGRIEADALPGSLMRGDWSLVTSDGGIRLRLPPDLHADLDARTGDGHIDVDFPITVAGRIDRHELRATMNGGGPLLELRTSDGSIHIEH